METKAAYTVVSGDMYAGDECLAPFTHGGLAWDIGAQSVVCAKCGRVIGRLMLQKSGAYWLATSSFVLDAFRGRCKCGAFVEFKSATIRLVRATRRAV